MNDIKNKQEKEIIAEQLMEDLLKNKSVKLSPKFYLKINKVPNMDFMVVLEEKIITDIAVKGYFVKIFTDKPYFKQYLLENYVDKIKVK